MRQVHRPNLQLDRAIYYHVLQNEEIGLAGPLVSALSKIPDSEQQHFSCILFKAHRLQQTVCSSEVCLAISAHSSMQTPACPFNSHTMQELSAFLALWL